MRVDLALTNLMEEDGLGKVEKSHIDGDEEDFECLIDRGEDEDEDNDFCLHFERPSYRLQCNLAVYE